MESKRGNPSVIGLSGGKAFLAHAAAAMHVATLKNNRIMPLREIVVQGIEKLLADSDYEIHICLKILAKHDFSGSDKFFIGLAAEEIAMVAQLQPRLRVLSMLDITRPTTIKLAIIRMTRFETKDKEVEAGGISMINIYLDM
jgi:hypothetical protein